MSYQHRVYSPDGSWWIDLHADDATRTVTTYDEAGSVITSRPYGADENAAADDLVAIEAAQIARAEAAARVRAIVDDLQAEKTRYDEVIASSASTVAQLRSELVKSARAGKRVADAAIDLARYVRDPMSRS